MTFPTENPKLNHLLMSKMSLLRSILWLFAPKILKRNLDRCFKEVKNIKNFQSVIKWNIYRKNFKAKNRIIQFHFLN